MLLKLWVDCGISNLLFTGEFFKEKIYKLLKLWVDKGALSDFLLTGEFFKEFECECKDYLKFFFFLFCSFF